ncbi:MAG: DUF3795 domain-containing protein [Bacteroidota bacterium]|nr:DUF3795 domain-containing protein [Bacteroidota bacterium]
MNKQIKRREFIVKSSQACLACCVAMFATPGIASGIAGIMDDEVILDPKKRNYCGYICPEDCQFLEASVNNDVDLKKEAYKNWGIEERFGIEFEADKIFCFGCKNKDKPEGVVLANCTVRQCVIDKELDCCIECEELVSCDKELWDRYPEFKEQMIELREKYVKSEE